MQSIEINTSQNVTIEYELASLRDRILAFVLDSFIIWGSISVLSGFGVIAFGEAFQYAVYFIILPIFFFYSLCFEIFNGGQTWGKKALNIKVVAINGAELTVNDFMLRWVFRTIDIYATLGAIATMLVSSSDKNQRLGDILAKTVIIKDKPVGILKLNSILNINALEKHKITYPEVRKFSEGDMLLVKKVVEQVKKHPNAAHREALKSLVENLSRQLSLKQPPKNHEEFLKVVLRDYIVLTR